MIFISLLLLNFLVINAQEKDTGFCNNNKFNNENSCLRPASLTQEKYLLYDVNLPEGFNLRRDVYMRFAIMLAEAQKNNKWINWKLILPPWYRLYHWKSDTSRNRPVPWSHFFDVKELNSYAPVKELHEIFFKNSTSLEIDTIYVLENFEDAFEGGTFIEKWEIDKKKCAYNGNFWGYNNITAKEIVCVKYQGKISNIRNLIALHPTDQKVMFSHGEIPLHDSYGTKSYWDCRKSMKFNKELVSVAENFIFKQLECYTNKCTSYISVHWRRQDFTHSRSKDVPSLSGTVRQIEKAIQKNKLKVTKIFIATDANELEINNLKKALEKSNLAAYFFIPSEKDLIKYKDGGVAIIEQIICSHALYFIGTHESTFTFRIQEEREILGFDSKTTFNRLCPDTGLCENPSRWTVVH